jgi:hypothetical protein
MACRTCGLVLNRYVDAATGRQRLLHPLQPDGGDPNHEPDPAPADQVDARHRCDFCSDEKILYVYRSDPIETIAITDVEQFVQRYGTDWSACAYCAALVDDRDLDGLHTRVTRTLPPLKGAQAHALRVMQRAVLDAVQPGHTLATIGHWPAVPLPAPTLPKVRDRLAGLIRGPDRLPLDLDDLAVRETVSAGLDAARLYWIDPEFTDLATHAAARLPATSSAGDHAPAPHGLIAWAAPVGQRGDITAATWTTGPDGLLIVCHRSVGAGLDPPTLQQVREQVGWLAPRYATRLGASATVAAGDPAAFVVATWLLIGQKLAESVPVSVDKSIRKAYQRTGRATPEVRLIRMRGTTAAPAGATSAGGAGGGPREYRWWVRGHWRNQPYGPGRAQRRLIYIDPQLRGPEDKPIKASTTVRILGHIQQPGR